MVDAGQAALVATVLVPAVVGTALTLGSRADRLAAPISVAAAALTCALSVVAAVGRPSVGTPFVAGSELALGVDELSALVLPTVTAVTLLVLVFSAGDVTESRRRFHGLMLLFAAAVNITVTAETLPTLLLGWEVMGATSYALIGFQWREPRRVAGGLTAFLTTRSADLGLYLAAAAALAGGAGLAIADLPAASPGWRHVHRRRHSGGRPRQGRAAAVLVLAVPRDGGPQPGQRAVALRGDGGHGWIPAAAQCPAAGSHRVG